MNRRTLIAGMAAATLAPSVAFASTSEFKFKDMLDRMWNDDPYRFEHDFAKLAEEHFAADPRIQKSFIVEPEPNNRYDMYYKLHDSINFRWVRLHHNGNTVRDMVERVGHVIR